MKSFYRLPTGLGLLCLSLLLSACAEMEENESAEDSTPESPAEVSSPDESVSAGTWLNTSPWMPALQVGDELVFLFHHVFPQNEELNELYREPYVLTQTVKSWEDMDDQEILMTIRFEEDGPHGLLEGSSHYRISPHGLVLLQEGLVDGGHGHYIPGSLMLPGRLSEDDFTTHRTRILERVRGQETNLSDSRRIRMVGRETITIAAGEFPRHSEN